MFDGVKGSDVKRDAVLLIKQTEPVTMPFIEPLASIKVHSYQIWDIHGRVLL